MGGGRPARALAGIATLASGASVPVGGALTAAGPLAAAAATVAKLRGVLGERARGALTEPLGPSAFAELVRAPDYERQSGPLFLVRADLQRVLDLVATPQRPLVVFVDDLDRCSPGTVVQVIEAINLFVAGEYPNTIFVIAMEPAMVAAHIEAAYADLVAVMGPSDGRQAFDLGWRFLEKIVQLPLTLPTVGEERARGYVASLFPPAAAPAEARQAAPDEVAVRLAEERLRDTGSVAETVERAGSAARPDGPAAEPEAVREAARRILERRLSSESPDVQAVVEFASGHLDDNPREIKRFVNVFRYFVMIAAERRLQGIGEPVPLKALAKMAILLVRWPGLLEALTREVEHRDGRPPVLTVLESAADARAARKALAGEGLPEPLVEALLGRELAGLLDEPPLIGRLTDGFL